MVVDAVANLTIIMTDPVPKMEVNTISGMYVITTTNGETMDVSSEMMVNVEVGSKKIPHSVYGTDC